MLNRESVLHLSTCTLYSNYMYQSTDDIIYKEKEHFEYKYPVIADNNSCGCYLWLWGVAV